LLWPLSIFKKLKSLQIKWLCLISVRLLPKEL
jgi:hypothetical protein